MYQKIKIGRKEEKCVDCKNCLGTHFDKIYCKVYIDDATRLFRLDMEKAMRRGEMYPLSSCIYYRKRSKNA